MLKEFKEFALRGSVLDMAVGIIIGAAFATVAKSMVDDIIMPPIGLMLGDVQFQDLFVLLKPGDPPGTLRHARTGPRRGSGPARLRGVRQQRRNVIPGRFRRLPDRQGLQSAAAGRGRETDDPPLSPVLVGHPDRGDPLRPLHLRAHGRELRTRSTLERGAVPCRVVGGRFVGRLEESQQHLVGIA
jgi:hypothetical protein